jgi:hypothetical protein
MQRVTGTYFINLLHTNSIVDEIRNLNRGSNPDRRGGKIKVIIIF